jgi:hypothetical protein
MKKNESNFFSNFKDIVHKGLFKKTEFIKMSYNKLRNLTADLESSTTDLNNRVATIEGSGTVNKPRSVTTTQTVTVSNNSSEVLLFSQSILAGTWNIGDYVHLRSVNEVLSLGAGGELRQRVWIGPIGGTGLVTGFLSKNSTGITGFEYNWFNIVDTGAGPTAARLVGAAFSGIDVVADITQNIIINWTGQMTVADPTNSYRGVSANLIVL